MNTIYTAEIIEDFSEQELLNGDWLDDVFSLSDEIERERIIVNAELRAKKLDCDKQFKRIVAAYRRELNRNIKENSKLIAVKRQSISLERDDRGQVAQTISNFLQVLNGDAMFETLKLNTLTHSPEKYVNGKVEGWSDADDAAAREYIERKYKIHSTPKLDDAFRVMFAAREYNPVIDLIDSIEWDGVPRVHTLLSKWMMCENSPYTQEVSRLIFAGGIHRLYNPGCKFDEVPVLIGTKQGEGKSTFVRWLAMRDEYFTEITEIEGQKGMESIEGAWVCEMGELLALTRAKDVEAVKSFITRQVDHYRRPYDRRTSDYKRQCVFIGTTNKQQFLTDRTGNRRFYPVTVKQSGYDLFDKEAEIKNDIKQCWAEAKSMYDKGELHPYADRELVDIIKQMQSDATEDDYRVGMIESYLDGKKEVCVIEIWKNALDNQIAKPTRKDSNEISLIMQDISGWVKVEKARRTNDFGVQKCWVREGEQRDLLL